MAAPAGGIRTRFAPWPRPTERSRSWTAEYAVIAYFASIGLGVVAEIVLVALGVRALLADGALIVEIALLLTLVPLWRRGSLRSPADLGLRFVPGARSVGLAVLAFVLYGAFSAFWTAHTANESGSTFSGLKQYGTIATVVAGFAACVGAPVAEEIFFRGLIYRCFLNRLSIVPACMLAALLFALVHTQYSPSGRVVIFAFGIITCLLYERTGSLLPGIAVHSLVDGTGFEYALTGHATLVPTFYALVAIVLLLRPPVAAVIRLVRGKPPFRYPLANAAGPPGERSTPVAHGAPAQLELFTDEFSTARPASGEPPMRPQLGKPRRGFVIAVALMGAVLLYGVSPALSGYHVGFQIEDSRCVTRLVVRFCKNTRDEEEGERAAEFRTEISDGERASDDAAESLARLATSAAEEYAAAHQGYDGVTPLLLHEQNSEIQIEPGGHEPYLSQAVPVEEGGGVSVTATASTGHTFTITSDLTGAVKRTCTPVARTGVEGGGCQNSTW
jgi:membrane protease YdiL (CAAX protease family)